MTTDRRLYFHLQRAAHRLRVDADRRCARAAGITAAQLGALYALRERPGSTQRELAARLGQRESAITAMVGRLTAAGLVHRRPHPHEHRAVVLTLTDDGGTALERAAPETAAFERELRDLLGPAFDVVTEALGLLADPDGRCESPPSMRTTRWPESGQRGTLIE